MQTHWKNRLVLLALSYGLGACANINLDVTRPNAASTGDEQASPHTSMYRDATPLPPQLASAEQRLLQDLAADPDDLDTLVKLGVLYRHVENFAAADKVLARAAEVSGGAAEVLNEIAITQRASGAFEQARDTYLNILSIAPDFHNAKFNLGILYDLYLGEAELAHKYYSAYLDAAPNADGRVEKWLADLRRRFGISPETSVVNVNE